MRLVNIHGVNDVRVDEVPEPKAGPDDVILKIHACGVCGTDLTFIKLGGTGYPGGISPMPLGHEASGSVLEVGANVQGLKPGMRVILNPMTAKGVIGNGGAEGAFADKLLVSGAKLNEQLYVMPENMPFHLAALVEPMGVARHGVNRANPQPDSKCVVFGAGPIGLGAVLWLKRRGVKSVVSVDLSKDRLEAAKALGADHTLVAGERDLKEALIEFHGEGHSVFGPSVGTDIFLDYAGASQVLSDVIDFAKQGARIMIVAIKPVPEPVDFTKVVVKELSILGSCGYPDEYPDVIADIAAMGADAEKLISHRFSFDQVQEALKVAKTGASTKVMVEFA